MYAELKRPHFYIFAQSLKSGIVPDKLKIAKVFPIYKSEKKYALSNYRPISVLPCFSKILERIMYNRLYNYLNENEILNDKQLCFRAGHSTEHAILELNDQASNAFDNKNFVLGVFIDLSKAFDTVDHNILLQKLSMHSVKRNNLKWSHSYLSNQKQYIEFQNDDKKEKTNSLTIKCGIPQGSILGPLLFIAYVNDLYSASNILKPIMFADDTNLFCSGKHIETLFQTANIELEKMAIWFQANKPFLNESKTKFTLVNKSWGKDNLPLKLPILKINNFEIKRTTSIKFLGIMVDENLTWNNHIHILENKLSKNIGLLYRAKPYLDKNTMTTLYFSFFRSYLNYGNIA